MSISELETRISEIQKELSVVKEVSSPKLNIFELFWRQSCL